MVGGKRRVKKIDYKNKKFENPFFDKKRNKTKKKFSLGPNWRIKLYIFLGIILIAFIVWVFFYSKVFSVQKIVVEGVIRVAPNEIADIARQQAEEKKYIIASQNNIFLFDTEELKNKLKTTYSFNEINVYKTKPGTITIKIVEKSYAYIWKEEDKYYYSDIDGFIITEVNPLDITEINHPLIVNHGSPKIVENLIRIDAQKINFISGVFSYLSKGNAHDIEVENFMVGNEENKVTLKIVDGPDIYLNAEETADEQIAKLLIIKDQKLKSDFYNKEYIDLRFGDKVYYR